MPTDGAVPRASSRELSARLARASEQRPARTSASSQEAARTDVSPSLTNPRAHTPAPSLTILPLLLPSLVGEDRAPQGGRFLFSQAPSRCGFEPSLVQTRDVKGGAGALSTSSPSSLQTGVCPAGHGGPHGPAGPQEAAHRCAFHGGGNRGCERLRPVRGRSELGAPDSKGCAYQHTAGVCSRTEGTPAP